MRSFIGLSIIGVPDRADRAIYFAPGDTLLNGTPSDGERSRTDLPTLLGKVEAASPVEAIDVVADELRIMFGASTVSFLIADFTGRAVVRFEGPVSRAARGRRNGVEHAQTVRLPGTVYEQVLRTQQVDLRQLDDGVQLIVPVTDRGDAIGVVELHLPWRLIHNPGSRSRPRRSKPLSHDHRAGRE